MRVPFAKISSYVVASMFIGPAIASAEVSMDTVKQLAGCFAVDYNYSETKVLADDYTLDPRVFDATSAVTKELVKIVDEGPDHLRLQHFLQADSYEGETIFMMRHHAEIWRRHPAYHYEYVGRQGRSEVWNVEYLSETDNRWVREITNLDDGLRYHCAGHWIADRHFPSFACDAYAPIPGRETRDMGRGDYNTMDRHTEVRVYGSAWLERQRNVKIRQANGERKPLVEEVGKIWSVRLPDEECEAIENWAAARQPFWNILGEVWQSALDGSRPFKEIQVVDGSSRKDKIDALMRQYYRTVATNSDHERIVREELAQIIAAHRE